MSAEVLDTLQTRLTKMFPEKAPLLENGDPGEVPFSAFALDSLDTLQFAMDIEEVLDIEIEAVDFAPGSTLADLARSIAAMVAEQRG